MVRVKDRPSGAAPSAVWSSQLGVGREGGSAGGRREYVHVARSPLARVRSPAHTARPGLGILPNPPVACLGPMALTPPADPPSRPRTISCAPREDQKKNQKQKPVLQAFVSTKVDTYQSRTPFRPIAAICRRWGGAGWQDRWRHGWRHRAPMDGFTACPANPHRPAQPSENQRRLLRLLSLRRLPSPLAGAGLQALPEPHITQQASATAVRLRPSHASSRPDAASRPPATGIAA